MILSSFVIDRIFNVLKNKPLDTVAPLYVKFYQTEVDVTNTLFGITEYVIATDKWDAPVNKQIQNSSSLTIGTLLVNVTGELTLNFYTSTDELLFSYTYTANLVAGSVYTILTNALKITLQGVTVALGNFLLNYFFRGDTTGKPTSWYLELQDTTGTAYQTRIQLELDKFSHMYTHELGYQCVGYGKYLSINTATNKELKYARLFTNPSGGSHWFDAGELLPYNVYSGRTLEIFNNSFLIAIPPASLSSTFVLPNDPDSIFYVDFDGTYMEHVNSVFPVAYPTPITYNATDKLFKAECVELATGVFEYAGFSFPDTFTLEMFVRFTSNPIGRDITFLERTNSFKLYKTASNELKVDNQNGNIVTVTWSPVINNWYHLYINKVGTSLNLIVNGDVDETVTVSATGLFADNSNTLKVNSSTAPILGLCNGVYISSNDNAFAQYSQPLPKSAYDWKYVSSLVWRDLSLEQWYEYNKV